MKKNLNILSSTLRSNGHIEASKSVNDLINSLDNLNNIKMAEPNTDPFRDFRDLYMSKTQPSVQSGTELERWMKILKDYDKKPYRVEKMHEISDSIFKTILSPLTNDRKDLEATVSNITNEDKSLISDMVSSSQLDSTAACVYDLVKEANNYIKIDNITTKEYNLFLKKLAAEQEEGQGFWSKLLEGDKAKEAARKAGELPGFWERAWPVVGLMFSVPLTIKNLYEAYINGKKIAEELPLEKYGINKYAALTGNPIYATRLIKDIQGAIIKNEDNPENLYEVLEIAKTISAYWLDVIFSITNTLMLIIDLLTLAAAASDLALPFGDIAGGLAGAFVSFGLVGVEFASEHYVAEFWEKETRRIKYIAEKKVKELGGEAPVKTDSYVDTKADEAPAVSSTIEQPSPPNEDPFGNFRELYNAQASTA